MKNDSYKRKIDIDEMVKLYNDGKTQCEIAKYFSVSQPAVVKALKKQGLKREPKVKEISEVKKILRGQSIYKLKNILEVNELNKILEESGECYRYIALTKREKAIVNLAAFNHINSFSWSFGQYPIRYAGKGITPVTMHKEVLKFYGKDFKETDHISQNKLDNRIENLREVSHRENCINRANFNCCVKEQGEKYVVSLRIGKEYKYIGSYESFEIAKEEWKKIMTELGVREEFLDKEWK